MTQLSNGQKTSARQRSDIPPRLWLTTEQRFLIENYAEMGPTKIAAHLNRSVKSVTNHAHAIRTKQILPFGPTSPGGPIKPLGL